MRIARETLKRRVEKRQSQLVRKQKSRGECTAKLDRLQLLCDGNPAPPLNGFPGFKCVQGSRITRPRDGSFQAYGRARWFQSTTSSMKFSIESDRREPWIAPYRVTLYADDRTGLVPDEVLSILALLPDFRMTVVELALDFQ